MYRLFVLLALALCVFGAPAHRALSKPLEPPEIVPIPCWFPTAGLLVTVDCLLVSVPIDHDSPGSSQIAFGVVRVSQQAPKTDEPPVVFFPGGPGYPLMGGRFITTWMRDPTQAKVMFGSRTWLLIEQRGAGLSFPLLRCGNLPLSDAAAPTDGDIARFSACATGWKRAGIDLRHFRNADVAADAEALRVALHLAQVDVVGISYGGSYALNYLARYPHAVRAAVIDSGVPPESNTDEETPQSVARSLRILFTDCDRTPACATGHPRLAERLQQFMATLDAAQQEVVARALFEALYDQTAIASLPTMIERIISREPGYLESLSDGGSSYAQAQTLSVLCQDEIPYESIARMHEKAGTDLVAQALGRSIKRFWAICRDWPRGPSDSLSNRPVTASTPVLFLAGNLDPCCGPAYARAAARFLPASQVAEFPRLTHVTLAHSECARRLTDEFLQQPNKALDLSCANLDRPH